MLLQEARTNFHAHDKSVIPNYGRNKGKRGQGIEKLCGKDLCSGLLDFDDGEGKSHKEGKTIFVTQLQHCLPEIFDRSISYSQSKVGRKLENVLFIKFSKSGEYVNDLIFNAEKYREICYNLSEDYNYICEEIRRRYELGKELNTINGPRDKNGVHKLLQIRTKASKKSDGTYTPLDYNGKRLKNKAMAFYLTRKFENLIF